MDNIVYYTISTADLDHINRVWDWCQYSGRSIPMYKTRLGLGVIAWVCEVPCNKVQTLFLLNFSQWVAEVKKPSYL